MSRLEELIAELCPDGVEYRSLSEIFNTRNGYTPSKSNPEFWENGTVPWFRMEDIRVNGRILHDAIQKVSRSAIKGELFPANSIIIATSATIGEHALLAVESLANQRFTYLLLKPEYKYCFDTKFLFYYCFKLDSYCLENLNQGNFASVDMKRFNRFPFPIPPLPVQQEIVKILDSFTALSAELSTELSTELSARQNQYKYYASMLIENAKDTRLTTLDEISDNCDNQRKPVTSGNREAGEIPYYGASGIVDYVKDYIIDGDYLLISEDGANLLARSTPIAFSITGKAWVNNHAHILKFHSLTTQKYVERYLNMTDLSPFITGAAQPKLNQKNLYTIQIPLPPMNEQKRIMGILDRFDAIANDITSGLPAEIAARRKQYEYYRDKLLTFKKLS